MKRSVLYLAIFSLAIDLVAVLAGLVIAYSLRADGGVDLYFWPFQTYFRYAALTLPVWLIVFASQGLYDLRVLPRGWNAFGRLLLGLIAGWGVILIALYLWRSPEANALPRLIIIYGFFLTAGLVLVGRVIVNQIVTWLYEAGIGVIRTVIISQSAEDELLDEFARHPVHGRRVIAIAKPDDVPEKLTILAKTERIDEIIVSDNDLPETKVLAALNWAEGYGANFLLVPSLLSLRATNVETGVLAGRPVMYFLRTPLEGWQRLYKRIFDLIVVMVFLVVLSPLFLLLAILVKLTSRGPVIYKQARVGQDGQRLFIHKFRSMYVDGNEKFKNDWSTDESTDPRVTPLGRVLRATNLDELPQLWDIFRGALSIVGPRPEQPQYVEKFAKVIPLYAKRHHVKTGLTGWAQVNGLRGDTSIAERVKYDLYYIENWSVWFDLRIIIATIALMFRRKDGH